MSDSDSTWTGKAVKQARKQGGKASEALRRATHPQNVYIWLGASIVVNVFLMAAHAEVLVVEVHPENLSGSAETMEMLVEGVLRYGTTLVALYVGVRALAQRVKGSDRENQ